MYNYILVYTSTCTCIHACSVHLIYIIPDLRRRWLMAEPLFLEATGRLEYKYVMLSDSEKDENKEDKKENRCVWEPGRNRRLELRPVPQGMDLWVVRDQRWGFTERRAMVFPYSLRELYQKNQEAERYRAG